MLVGNGVRYGGQPMRTLGGAQIGNVERGRWSQAGAIKNFYSGEATVIGGASIADTAAFPNGHNHPSAWVLAPKAGGMSAYTSIVGQGAIGSANLAGGLNGEAALSGSGQISLADMVPIIQAVAALAGTGAFTGDITGKLEAVAALAGVGTISTAQLSSVLNAAAAISGSGLLSANIVGKLEATAALAGIGQITNADANMIVLASAILAGTGSLSADIIGAWFMQSGLSGTGAATAAISAPAHVAALLAGNGTLVATPYATGDMSALIVVSATEELTTSAIANAVWAALAASNNSAGSMGEMLNDIATSGGSLTVEQAEQLRDIFKLLGLDPAAPLTVTPTRRYVGPTLTPDIDQTIGGNGRTISTVTREP